MTLCVNDEGATFVGELRLLFFFKAEGGKEREQYALVRWLSTSGGESNVLTRNGCSRMEWEAREMGQPEIRGVEGNYHCWSGSFRAPLKSCWHTAGPHTHGRTRRLQALTRLPARA